MLVLTRNTDESIVIGDDIEITILEVNGKSVKLGIDAPRDVSVHRSEVYVQINLPTAQPLPVDEVSEVTTATI